MEDLMRKTFIIVFVIAFIVLSLVLGTPKSTQAFFIITPAPESWDTGTEFELDLTLNPPPEIWLQALSRGTKITEPGTICRPFRKGEFGWVASIYQLVDGKWMKLDTTFAWVPDEEGVFTACAKAPAAGIYAIFGYFDPALAPEKKAEPL
jgi:hypothetical protein